MRRSLFPTTPRQTELSTNKMVEYGLTGALIVVVFIAALQMILRLF